MPFWDVADVEACLRQELPWQGVDLLAMLHRAGGVVGHRRALRIDRLRLIKLAKKFRHILGERGNPRRFCRIGGSLRSRKPRSLIIVPQPDAVTRMASSPRRAIQHEHDTNRSPTLGIFKPGNNWTCN